jgi:hypothetical protein
MLMLLNSQSYSDEALAHSSRTGEIPTGNLGFNVLRHGGAAEIMLSLVLR